MKTSKSPWMVARVALQVGTDAFPSYSNKFSPHKFTQPQLFACLILKEFEQKDYRGVRQLLLDCADLRAAIGLTDGKPVPHWTTLQKASVRILKLPRVRRAMHRAARLIMGERRTNVKYAAGDSSGFDVRHASRYYVHRRDNDKANPNRPAKRVSYRRFGKLMLIVCCATHAILGAVASAGPTPDVHQLDDVLMQTPRTQIAIRHLVLDAGFDSSHNHKLLRDYHGIRSTIPPRLGRPRNDPASLPSDPYRRLMRTRFNQRAYSHRPQVETVFSMMKRNFGVALRGRSHPARMRDLMLRALTHNVAL